VNNVLFTLRSSLKQLMPFPAQLQSLKAKMSAKAITEPLHEQYAIEIGKMMAALNSWIFDAGDLCAVAEAISPDTNDQILNVKQKELLAKSVEGEHHMFGARAAVKRFQSIVN
jgi:hypothetical protein